MEVYLGWTDCLLTTLKEMKSQILPKVAYSSKANVWWQQIAAISNKIINPINLFSKNIKNHNIGGNEIF